MDLFNEAQQYIPGGVNSPVRAFKAVGGNPVFFKRGEGAYLYDHDDKQYIDYVLSWGPMLRGHCYPPVVNAIRDQITRGLSFGAPTGLETEIAKRLCNLMPNMDLVRMVNSGTEATMSAIRLARGYTGRETIIKFEGCYHGHSDSLLVKAGSGALTLGVPSSPGVPSALAEKTVTLTYNDIEGVKQTMADIGDQVACIILEPVVGNMSCIPPIEGFLETLRAVCDQYGSVLIVDEVMTGFRVSKTGAQGYYNLEADLTCLGKVIGGGMPTAAFGGKRAIMEHLAPLGPVYQAGTLSGNPVAMAAGLAMLDAVEEEGLYEQLTAATTRLVEGLQSIADEFGIPFTTNHVGSMFGIFFTEETKVENYQQVMACNKEHYNKFFHGMLNEGVYLAPASYEAGFTSSCHTDEVIDETLARARRVMATL